MLRQFKLQGGIVVPTQEGTLEVQQPIQIEFNFDMSDCMTIPVYDNTKEDYEKRKKFNRAKEKRKTQKFIEDELDFMEELEDKERQENKLCLIRIFLGKELVLWKMTNMLRCSAQSSITDTTLTDKQKKEQMETIEQLMYFIKDFDRNVQILEQNKQKPLTDEQVKQMEKYDMGYIER